MPGERRRRKSGCGTEARSERFREKCEAVFPKEARPQERARRPGCADGRGLQPLQRPRAGARFGILTNRPGRDRRRRVDDSSAANRPGRRAHRDPTASCRDAVATTSILAAPERSRREAHSGSRLSISVIMFVMGNQSAAVARACDCVASAPPSPAVVSAARHGRCRRGSLRIGRTCRKAPSCAAELIAMARVARVPAPRQAPAI